MQKSYFHALLALMLLLSACNSQRPLTTERITEMGPDLSGNIAYYALPRTVIVIDVEVERSTKTPGPYAEFAETYLGLNDVIFSPSHSYEITSVSINGFAEPDPEQIYYIIFPEENEQSFCFSLNEAGLLHSVNKKIEDPVNQTAFVESKDYGIYYSDATFNYFMDSIMKEQIDTIIETVPLDTITLQRQTLRRSWVEKSKDLRAKEVADYILEIREKKFDLISGFQEINYSMEALKYMYTEMDKMESDYLDLFTGITTTETINHRFVHKPDKEDIVRRHTLFRFSGKGGIKPAGADEGFPVTISYNRSKATDMIREQVGRHSPTRRKDEKGIHYRIPEYADLLFYIGEEKRAEARTLVSQFGIVTHLPAKDLQIEFHPMSGSIKSAGLLTEEDD